MTETVSAGAGAPQPKAATPPLDARAPRPAAVRLRKGVVIGAVTAGAGLVGGALAWAFVVQPGLRAQAHDARQEARPTEARGTVRPSEKVTGAPATYADIDRLPEPRTLVRRARSAGDPSRGARPQPTSRRAGRELAGDARNSGLFFAGDTLRSPAVSGETADADRTDRAAAYNGHVLQAPISPYEVKAGAVIPAALLTAVDTARSGPVTAAVTENIFDTVSGRYLLIPQGARLIGRHEGESRHGDRRAFVVWERLILPNGKSLALPKEPGVDAAGAVGVRGAVDRRLGSLAIATLFAGAITTLGQVARDHDDTSSGLLGDAGDAAAIEAAQVGGKLIERELEVRPTIRLPSGSPIGVFITRDLILEPYRP